MFAETCTVCIHLRSPCDGTVDIFFFCLDTQRVVVHSFEGDDASAMTVSFQLDKHIKPTINKHNTERVAPARQTHQTIT